MHQLTNRRVVDCLGGADQRNPTLFQVSHDDGIVKPIARKPGQLIYDDVVDVAFPPDAIKHFLEFDALGDLRCRPARFYVFTNDVQPKLLGFIGASRPLRGKGDSFWIEVFIYLTGSRHSKVEQCPRAWRCLIFIYKLDVFDQLDFGNNIRQNPAVSRIDECACLLPNSFRVMVTHNVLLLLRLRRWFGVSCSASERSTWSNNFL
ncbi:hypothetical protein LBW94_037515 [Nocardia sp. alder85J]|nr:hypothetical protein [Nocardia sp. alder85J]MCX4098062.1 hypothetical protein [Nocardia sp. alder85J]